MKNIQSILGPLKSEVFVENTEVEQAAKLLAEKIFKQAYKRRNRTYEQVFKSCFIGRIAEVGVKKLLGAEDKLDILDDQWNVKDRTTYGCDLVVDDIRIEIKSQKGKWFELTSAGLKTLRNNIQERVLDVIITASYDEQDGGYIVKPKMIINPYTALQYMKQSNYDEHKFFFDHLSAARKNDCLIVR